MGVGAVVELKCFNLKSKGWNQPFQEDKGLQRLTFSIDFFRADTLALRRQKDHSPNSRWKRGTAGSKQSHCLQPNLSFHAYFLLPAAMMVFPPFYPFFHIGTDTAKLKLSLKQQRYITPLFEVLQNTNWRVLRVMQELSIYTKLEEKWLK